MRISIYNPTKNLNILMILFVSLFVSHSCTCAAGVGAGGTRVTSWWPETGATSVELHQMHSFQLSENIIIVFLWVMAT